MTDGLTGSRIEDMGIPVAADPEPALGVAARGDGAVANLEERERLGGFGVAPRRRDADVPVDRASGIRSPPTFRSSPVTPWRGSWAAWQARSMIHPLAIALSVSGERDRRVAVPLDGSRRQASARRGPIAEASSATVGVRSCNAHAFQSCVSPSTRGSKAPPLEARQRSAAWSTSNSSGASGVGAWNVDPQRENSLDGS